MHRHDDLGLGLGVEPGEQGKVASGGATGDGEALGVDGARVSQLLDETLW